MAINHVFAVEMIAWVDKKDNADDIELRQQYHCSFRRFADNSNCEKMRILTDFLLPLSQIFLMATGLQLICEFAAQNSQTSRNVIANSQCIRKLFSRRSCDIHTNVARTSHD